MPTGWIKLHRKIEEWPLYFAEPFTKAHAWIDLLVVAQFHPSTINVRGNLIDVKRGEIAWSEDALARRWLWSRNKVRRFLNWLETVQQIKLQKNNIISKIIVLNYEQYQQNDTTDDTAERQQTIQQTDTYKEGKKEKKVKNTPAHSTNDVSVSFKKFWDAYPKKIGRKNTEKAWQKLNPSSELCDHINICIITAKNSPQWKKDNGQFIPYPTTFLNQERWNDELETNLPKSMPIEPSIVKNDSFSLEDYKKQSEEREKLIKKMTS